MRTKAKVDKQLINHRTVAKACDVDTGTLRDWVARGEFPEPHCVIQSTWLYDKALIDHFLETGRWPSTAKFKVRRWEARA